MTAPTDHWIDTPSGRLYARSWPAPAGSSDRAPLVLLHDSLGSVALWRDFPAQLALAAGRQVVAYDRLGFGQSDPHPGRLGGDFIADEARGGFAALVGHLGMERHYLMGHSVGGGMALSIAAAEPARCLGVITISAQAFVEDRTLAGIRVAQAQFAEPGQLARLAKHHGDKAAWVLSAWIDSWLAPGFANWSLDPILPRVRCPVLTLHGERDEYGSSRHPERIVAGVAGPARYLPLAGYGHVPQRENPAVVLAAVSEFFAQHGDASAGQRQMAG